MQNEEPGLAGNLSSGYRSGKLDDVPSPSRTLPGNSVFGVIEFGLGYQLSSGIHGNSLLLGVPYFLFIHHLRGILGTLLREQQYLISERLNEKESN